MAYLGKKEAIHGSGGRQKVKIFLKKIVQSFSGLRLAPVGVTYAVPADGKPIEVYHARSEKSFKSDNYYDDGDFFIISTTRRKKIYFPETGIGQILHEAHEIRFWGRKGGQIFR